MEEAVARYESREAELTPENMRKLERQVMLRFIDLRWREHLYEMDYLQEGINLRAMGQKDPLVEWQREGFEMFSAMMEGIGHDFVRAMMHIRIETIQAPAPDGEAELRDVQTSGPEDPVQGSGAMRPAAELQPVGAGAPAGGGQALQPAPEAEAEPVNVPTVKSDWDKTPRNAPCPCGSGKKFKMCHGR